jgi:hypothetical protein
MVLTLDQKATDKSTRGFGCEFPYGHGFEGGLDFRHFRMVGSRYQGVLPAGKSDAGFLRDLWGLSVEQLCYWIVG